MSVNDDELKSVVKDAFVVLSGVDEIRYRDGDTWKAEEEETEHPIVHRLRSVSLSVINDKEFDMLDSGSLLDNERVSNANMRITLLDIEDVCLAAGMGSGLQPNEVLTWLKSNLVTA